MDFVKNNKLIVGLVAVIVVLLVGLFTFNMIAGGGGADNGGTGFESENVKQVDPDEIGLTLALRDDEKAVIITADKLDGIEALEYELTYDAEVEDEGATHEIPRGAVGSLNIKDGVAKAEVDLGTCSSGTCKYDKVISPITVLIKITYENGELGAAEDEITISSVEEE